MYDFNKSPPKYTRVVKKLLEITNPQIKFNIYDFKKSPLKYNWLHLTVKNANVINIYDYENLLSNTTDYFLLSKMWENKTRKQNSIYAILINIPLIHLSSKKN